MVGMVVVVVADMLTIAEAVDVLAIFAAAVLPEVLFLTAVRKEGKGHSRLKPVLPDVTSSGGTGHQTEQRGSTSTSLRATDPADK